MIGPNGSGKSTLLKLASGILRPTTGTVEVDGRVTALIELGAGFHPEITGRENVVINGMLLGLSRQEVERRMDGDRRLRRTSATFIDQPVKTYSSGMYVRLGFAVAVAVEPDILLIDEVLAVGDEAFTRRCLDRLARMRRRGVTMVLVSHDLDLVGHFADRARVPATAAVSVDGGSPDAVVARYRSDVAGAETPDDGARSAGAGGRGGPAVGQRRCGDRRGGGVQPAAARSGWSPPGRRARSTSGTGCTGRSTTSCSASPGSGPTGPTSPATTPISTASSRGASRRTARSGAATTSWRSRRATTSSTWRSTRADGLAYDYWCDAARVRVTSPVDWPGSVGPRPPLGGRRTARGSDATRYVTVESDAQRHCGVSFGAQKSGTDLAHHVVRVRKEDLKHEKRSWFHPDRAADRCGDHRDHRGDRDSEPAERHPPWSPEEDHGRHADHRRRPSGPTRPT